MEIDPAERTLSQRHQHDGGLALIDGMKMMTIWTNTDWEGVESIEHRNMDIIMEDLGVILMDNCMEVDVETAWSEMELMEGLVCEINTHSGPRLEQVPPKIANNTAESGDTEMDGVEDWRDGDSQGVY